MNQDTKELFRALADELKSRGMLNGHAKELSSAPSADDEALITIASLWLEHEAQKHQENDNKQAIELATAPLANQLRDMKDASAWHQQMMRLGEKMMEVVGNMASYRPTIDMTLPGEVVSKLELATAPTVNNKIDTTELATLVEKNNAAMSDQAKAVMNACKETAMACKEMGHTIGEAMAKQAKAMVELAEAIRKQPQPISHNHYTPPARKKYAFRLEVKNGTKRIIPEEID